MKGLRVLLLLPLLFVAACKVELNRGLAEQDANEVVSILLRHGIPASRRVEKAGTLTVEVEESRFADAVELLQSRGLPRQRFATLEQLFPGDGLVASPVQERARLTYGMGQELSRTLAGIDGVLSARVHLVMSEPDPLRRDPPPASASVLVRHVPDIAAGSLLPQIKQIVANGAAGLSYDRVNVVMLPAAAATNTVPVPAEMLVNVAGLWVQRDSAPLLRLMLTAGSVLLLLTLGVGGWWAWRRRADRSRSRALAR